MVLNGLKLGSKIASKAADEGVVTTVGAVLVGAVAVFTVLVAPSAMMVSLKIALPFEVAVLSSGIVISRSWKAPAMIVPSMVTAELVVVLGELLPFVTTTS